MEVVLVVVVVLLGVGNQWGSSVWLFSHQGFFLFATGVRGRRDAATTVKRIMTGRVKAR